LYFGSDDGIYEWPIGGALQALWKGVNAGLAISPRGTRLAFWDLGRIASADVYDLVIIDRVSRKEIRRWMVTTRYEADLHNFDLAFDKEGGVLYARTFDSDDARPLKAFDVGNGEVVTIASDSMGLSTNTDGVFFTRREGLRYALERIEGKAGHVVVENQFDGPRIDGNPNGHQLITPVAINGQVWVYDTSRSKKRFIRTKCDHAALFSDGTILFARGNRILWNVCPGD